MLETREEQQPINFVIRKSAKKAVRQMAIDRGVSISGMMRMIVLDAVRKAAIDNG